MKEKWLFIHGGWGGSWQWTPIIEILNSKNIESIAPTMPGMCSKNDSNITLDDHITYLEDLLKDISTPINIAAFSFGGLSATALAVKHPDLVNKFFYIDAFVPQPGQSFSDIAGEKISRQILAYTDVIGENNMIPPFFEEDSRYCNHPLQTIFTKIHYDLEILHSLNPVYIECTNKDPMWTFTPILGKTFRTIKKKNWLYEQIHSDHMPMYTHRDELSEILLN